MHAAEGDPRLLPRAVHAVIVVLVELGPEGAGLELDMNAMATLHGANLDIAEGARGVVGEGPGEAVLVVDGRPGVAVQRIIAIGRNHRVPRHDPLGHAPVVVARLRIAARADEQPAFGFHNLEFRRLVGLILRPLGGAMQRVGMQLAAMQPGHMGGIDAAFHGLQEIALLQPLRHKDMAGRQVEPFEAGHGRLISGIAHVGPQNARALHQRIGL